MAAAYAVAFCKTGVPFDGALSSVAISAIVTAFGFSTMTVLRCVARQRLATRFTLGQSSIQRVVAGLAELGLIGFSPTAVRANSFALPVGVLDAKSISGIALPAKLGIAVSERLAAFPAMGFWSSCGDAFAAEPCLRG